MFQYSCTQFNFTTTCSYVAIFLFLNIQETEESPSATTWEADLAANLS